VGKPEFSEWHVGQKFGIGRGLGRQLFIMTLDVFVFGMVFKATIGDTLEMPLDHMTYLLSGLVASMELKSKLVYDPGGTAGG